MSGWLSAIGGLFRLILRVIGLFSDRKAEDNKRRHELEKEIEELEEKDDITSGDIVDVVNRMQ